MQTFAAIMKKRQKKVLVILGSILLVVAVFLICLSPIAKWLIQKYDVPIVGREITVSWVYVNPFTGFVHLSNVVVFEDKSDSVFFKAKSLSANLAMYKLFSKTYDITSLTINKPTGFVIQEQQVYNFFDLIEKHRADESKKPTDEQVKFSLRNITINNGEFHYVEDLTPVNYFINNVYIKSTGYRYDVDTMDVDFAFSSGIGSGDIEGSTTLNLANQNYALDVRVDTFDLELINQYLKDLTNYGSMSAFLVADLQATGNFKSIDSLSTRGYLAIKNFRFKVDNADDLVSFKKLEFAVNLLSPKKLIYDFDSIILSEPYARYELYDHLDNVQAMFGAGGEKVAEVNADPNKFNLIIEVAKLVEKVSRNFLRSQYKVGRFAVYNGNFEFEDYSLGEKFEIGFSPFNILADSVDKAQNRVNLTVRSGIDPYGEFAVALSIDPEDSSYFDLNYQFQKIPLPQFNPYFLTFTSYPLDRGTLEFIGNWKVRASQIESVNHLIILDPRIAKRKLSGDNGWIPMPLAMAFIRERGNVIDYEIPIKGDLSDPKFNVWDAIFDLLKNIFIKPVTTPYRMDVKTTERELENSLSINWEHQKSGLTKTEEKFVDKIVDFLKENPEAKINVQSNSYAIKEKEHILLYEAKKKFFFAHHKAADEPYEEDDSVMVERLSIKDQGFVNYLNEQAKDTTLHTAQSKAARLVDASVINAKYGKLEKAREVAFLEKFKAEKVATQVVFLKTKEVIPFYGYSFFEITYPGKLPDYLREAFEEMNEFNKKAPREAYRAKRKKNAAKE